MTGNTLHAVTQAARSRALEALGKELSALLSEARAFTSEAAALFDPPLSTVGFQIVQWLHGSGPMRSMHIAEGVAIDRSALSRSLKQLERAHLVEAGGDPLDARATIYQLTAIARARMDEALASKGLRYAQRLARWPEADIDQLATLLRRLNTSEGAAQAGEP
jgi:DNA-binding MarR family transcriptional regulator